MLARAPMQSVTIGSVKVTYLPDGIGRFLATATFPNSTAEQWQSFQQYVDEQQRMLTSIGGFLIETGDRNIIMDTGTGPVQLEFPGFGPMHGGDYPASFAATGVAREAITDVVFTHLHLDHVGWTTLPAAGGGRELMFPNARHVVAQAEWDFWYGGDNPAGPHPEYVQQPLADIIRFIEPGADVAPGVSTIATPGHTPGHLSLLVRSGGQRLCLTADIMHVAAQVAMPEWTMAFDVDPAQATASRKRLMAELAQPDTLAAINHFSGGVFGRITHADSAYQWHPLTD